MRCMARIQHSVHTRMVQGMPQEAHWSTTWTNTGSQSRDVARHTYQHYRRVSTSTRNVVAVTARHAYEERASPMHIDLLDERYESILLLVRF
jgi:hypothetical protein